MYRRAPNDCLCTFLSPTLLSASGGVKRERKKLKKLPWEWLVFIKEREREYKEDKPFHSPLSMQKREKEKKHGLTFKVFSTSFPGALAHLWVRVLLFFLLLLTGWHQMLPPFPFFLSLDCPSDCWTPTRRRSPLPLSIPVTDAPLDADGRPIYHRTHETVMSVSD